MVLLLLTLTVMFITSTLLRVHFLHRLELFHSLGIFSVLLTCKLNIFLIALQLCNQIISSLEFLAQLANLIEISLLDHHLKHASCLLTTFIGCAAFLDGLRQTYAMLLLKS